MEDAFTITVAPERGLIRVALRGLWTVDTVARYQRALAAAVADISRGQLVALVDARELSAQPQEAVNRFKDRFSDNRFVPRRLATLVSSALFKRQAERIGVPNQRLFTDEGEAMAWLFSPDTPA